MNIHETELARFIVKEKRQRVMEALDHPTRRVKVLNKLAHNHFLREEYMHPIPKNIKGAETLYNYLIENGALEYCYIISEGDLDGKEMKLSEAIEKVHRSGWGTIISCIPGKLLYFEGEDEGEEYLLKGLIEFS